MKTLPNFLPYTRRFWLELRLPGRAPVLEGVLLRCIFVLLDGHLVLDVCVGRGELGLLVVEDGVDEVLLGLGQVTDAVALLLEALEDAEMEPNTLRSAAVPTLPLSGGKEKTVMASFLSTFFFLRRLAHFYGARGDLGGAVLERGDFPVLESRPEKMMGSRPPSSSGAPPERAPARGGGRGWSRSTPRWSGRRGAR